MDISKTFVKKIEKNSACRNPRAHRSLGILYSCYEGDPLTPPEGEASQGESPLTPARNKRS
jgi:hypothetical protein